MPYVVRDGVDGFLIEAGDVQALAEKLAVLVNDSALRVQMGKAAWNDAFERFSGRIVLQELESMYLQLK